MRSPLIVTNDPLNTKSRASECAGFYYMQWLDDLRQKIMAETRQRFK